MMRLDLLQQRIDNAKKRIATKLNTISKKRALIKKKSDKIRSLGFDPKADRQTIAAVSPDAYYLICDIQRLNEDIDRGNKEIDEIETNLAKYKSQLSEELEKSDILLHDIPEAMKQMQVDLVTQWDIWDISRRDKMKSDYCKLDWKSFVETYKGCDIQLKDKSDAQIHNCNVEDAKYLILDLYYRVRDITGDIIDWSDVHATEGAQGMTVLNGYVIGKEGRAEIESILAGGYNIQRLHVRVLVKEHK